MTQAVRTADDDEKDDFLRWLESEPADEIVDDLDALRAHFGVLRHSPHDGVALLRRLDGAAARILDISVRVRARLQELALPLPPALHAVATRLSSTLIEVALMFEEAQRGAEERGTNPGEVASCGRRALSLCHEAFVVSIMSANRPPAGLWRLAHRSADACPGDASYAAMLMMAAAQPESFTARQLTWIADFLDADFAGVQLSTNAEPLASTWWVDPEEDGGPVSAARKPAIAGGSVRQFSPAPFVRVVDERMNQLESVIAGAEAKGEMVDVEMADVELLDTEDEDDALPPGLTPVEVLSLLRTLRERWANSPLRVQVRRPGHDVVQVCLGLRALWELGRGRAEAGRVLEWQVINESPGGYAIINVAGIEGEIASGIVLGLRRPSEQSWTVCVVRWVRSDKPDQIELGLQVLAPSYYSAQVAFRGASLRSVAPALALPVVEPLRRHPAFLVPTGTYASRRFVFLREGTHLYVAQGRALGLDMQTASVELFQYDIDPYPI